MTGKLASAIVLALSLAACGQLQPTATPQTGGPPFTWPCQANG